MKAFYALITCIALASCAVAYNVSSRRSVLNKAVFGVTAVAIGLGPMSSAAQALEACPPKSSNCIRTTWTPPAGTSKADIVTTVKAVLNEYPQEGQNKVDLGGWKLVEDNLASAGTARVEYSSGIGTFAKYFNGGKPFVDDLKLEIDQGGVVQVRSSSRIGESDLDVNRKRLLYLNKGLAAAGWTVPEPKY